MDKMHTRAAEVLAELFAEMEPDPTLDELDVELQTAMFALFNVETVANATRPKGTPRLTLRPAQVFLQALTNQFHKDDATEVFKVGA